MTNRILAGQVLNQTTLRMHCRLKDAVPTLHRSMDAIPECLCCLLPPSSTTPLPPRHSQIRMLRRARPGRQTNDATPQRVPHSHVTAAPIHGLPILSRQSAWTPPRSPRRSRAATSGCSAARRSPSPRATAVARASSIRSATTGSSDAAAGEAVPGLRRGGAPAAAAAPRAAESSSNAALRDERRRVWACRAGDLGPTAARQRGCAVRRAAGRGQHCARRRAYWAKEISSRTPGPGWGESGGTCGSQTGTGEGRLS